MRARALSYALTLASLYAVPGAAKSPELHLEVSPLLSGGSKENEHWLSVLVRAENRGSAPIQGNIEVETRLPWTSQGGALSTRLPFWLAPGASSRLEAPTRAYAGSETSIRVRAFDPHGELIGEIAASSERPMDALVLDLATPSRLAPVLRGLTFASRRAPLYGGGYGGRARSCAIGVSSPPSDTATGDLVLPTRAAGYSAASLVVGSAQALARLGERERSALVSWVLTGGALALSLSRPEDFRNPTLRAVLGGEPSPGEPEGSLLNGAEFVIPPDDAETNPSSPLRSLSIAPNNETRARLVGYGGANLHPTEWGASASYGLGEVHLLAFDPEDPALLADPWTRYKVADLVRHAFDREPLAVLRQNGSGTHAVDGVRRELDPNQGTRWTIGVSAVVLLLYAVLAGPVGFYLAAKKGRPLRALLQLPLWSAATLGIVVLLGVIGKGLSGRARRLALVEAGAGMTQGSALFFRGFFLSSSRELVVRATRREHVLDLSGNPDGISRILTVDRDGPRLTGLRTRPWETLLVREEGFFDLSGGISLVPRGEDLVIKNRAARDLIGVVAKSATGSTHYFPRIRDGASVRLSEGRRLSSVGTPFGPTATISPLGAASFANTIDADFPGLGKVWRVMEPTLGSSSEWWPPDVPTLIAALDGGQGKLTDSGLRVDYDRLLVRVVGIGGVP